MAVAEAPLPPSPVPSPPDAPTIGAGQRIGTAVIVGLPFVGVVWAMVHFWGTGLHLRDFLVFLGFYLIVGHGVTVGFHRLFTHRSFVAARPLKIALAAAGSMAFEGGLIGWVGNHRRHHVYSDQPGDPHSPVNHHGTLRGLWHAHVGWLFSAQPDDEHRTRDLKSDPDLRWIDRAFPLLCVVSLGLPFLFGWVLSGWSLSGALTALLWGGLVRICLLHHVTWSINSLCHTFGRRPHETSDRSADLGLLSILSMGESWHNSHHASPRSARHGRARGQRDSSAALIGAFERLGLATKVCVARENERAAA
ncbi:MAG: fatty acid desaturase [Acidimicrobiales bacterium]